MFNGTSLSIPTRTHRKNGSETELVPPLTGIAFEDEDRDAHTSTQNTRILDRHRRAALAEVDNAKLSWFHVKVCLVAGVGFFTDAYDIFAINIASTMLGYVFGRSNSGNTLGTTLSGGSSVPTLTKNQELAVKVATPIGTLCGQLVFGWLADMIGRKRMYGVELIIIIISTFGQTIAGASLSVSIIGVLFVWRFLAGIGIGGDYPLSAIISSEFASTRIRGRMMTAVFANQGWGQFTAALVAIIITAAFKSSIDVDANIPLADHTKAKIDQMWRILIGFGCIPGVVALYFRLTIPETPRFTMDIERNVQQASKDIEMILRGEVPGTPGLSSAKEESFGSVGRIGLGVGVEAPRAGWKDFRNHFAKWANMKVLIGTAYSWFAQDIAFYGLGLNSDNILIDIGFGLPSGSATATATIFKILRNICTGNLILSLLGLIPGYWATFLFIDSWGRKPIQLMGFVVLTIVFLILGFAYNKISTTPPAFVFLYCVANFFQNFGPNTTTFIVPGEVFPTRYRSTAHGISAASGKLGAIVAQVAFATADNIGMSLRILAFFMFTGIFSTLLIPETNQKSLEELSNEEQDGFFTGESLRPVR